ncbi:hypothetical protein AYO38_08085 [bacterium SCGC AG-212-C10]|nr:hypothetical protein AYO38_08085 [bacterium SCGC AG-212-C10]
MPEITEEFIRSQVAGAKPYIVVLLKRGPNFESTQHVHMEHLKHIFALRQSGEQVITLPVTANGGDLCGISVFVGADAAHVEELAAADPAVTTGRFVYELVNVMGIPGDGIA